MPVKAGSLAMTELSVPEQVQEWCAGHGPLVDRLKFFSKDEKTDVDVLNAVGRYINACQIKLPFSVQDLVLYWD